SRPARRRRQAPGYAWTRDRRDDSRARTHTSRDQAGGRGAARGRGEFRMQSFQSPTPPAFTPHIGSTTPPAIVVTVSSSWPAPAAGNKHGRPAAPVADDFLVIRVGLPATLPAPVAFRLLHARNLRQGETPCRIAARGRERGRGAARAGARRHVAPDRAIRILRDRWVDRAHR